MKKVLKIMLCAITVGVVIFAPAVAYKKTSSVESFPKTTPTYKTVVKLWNIDVFEGGIGSRGDFLSKVSLGFKGSGTLVMVISHTVESAKKSVEKGEIPDIVSFGVGVDFLTPYVKKLSETEFKGGENGGQTYAYPWCRGGYFLITKTEDNQPIDQLIVSQNEYNMPYGAINMSKLSAIDTVFEEPLKAYTDFLSGKGALLGTQRDIWRLQKRGVSFFAKPLEKFCDLIQYVAVTTCEESKFSVCHDFCKYLLSNGVQNKITEIGMFPMKNNPYADGLGQYQLKNTEYTVSPFTSAQFIKELNKEFTAQKITNDSLLRFKNVLKRL